MCWPFICSSIQFIKKVGRAWEESKRGITPPGHSDKEEGMRGGKGSGSRGVSDCSVVSEG